MDSSGFYFRWSKVEGMKQFHDLVHNHGDGVYEDLCSHIDKLGENGSFCLFEKMLENADQGHQVRFTDSLSILVHHNFEDNQVLNEVLDKIGTKFAQVHKFADSKESIAETAKTQILKKYMLESYSAISLLWKTIHGRRLYTRTQSFGDGTWTVIDP